MKKYVISPHTLFDADENLYFLKIGVEGKDKPVHFTVWGKTPQEAQTRGNELVEALTKPNTVLMPGIDFKLLKKQKIVLVELQLNPENYNLNDAKVDAITGITNLIDAIQDSNL